MRSGETVIERATTALFVPGDRPERFEKAAASGADLVILDLEDAVPRERREQALAGVINALQIGFRALVRIVGVDDTDHAAQVEALAAVSERGPGALLGVMVAKVGGPADLDHMGEVTKGRLPIVALLETVRGVEAAKQIARDTRVTRLAFGGQDYVADIGGTHRALLDQASCRLVLASRLGEIVAPLASPTTSLRERDVILRDASRAAAMGFGGQLCIHPDQIPHVREAFRPTDHEVAWAKEIVETGDGAHAVNGVMVDPPVIARALAVLARADREREGERDGRD